MYCPNCKINTEGNFCPECGTKLVEEDIIICPKCGAKLTPGAKFCSECGASIQQKPSDSTTIPCKEKSATPESQSCSKHKTSSLQQKNSDPPITNRHKYCYFPKSRRELEQCIIKEADIQLAQCKKVLDFNMIDVSAITDMSRLFYNFVGHHVKSEKMNFDVSNWDVANVMDMSWMFNGCRKFNSDLSRWKVSNVIDMNCMFYECENFNSDLSTWDVSNVENMSQMFTGCRKFNSNLSEWNVSNVTDMFYLFYNCVNFNSDLSKWDVSNVQLMQMIFGSDNGSTLYNLPLWAKKRTNDIWF